MTLFPMYYFHVIPEEFLRNSSPSYLQRAFGYVEKINFSDEGGIDVTIVLNKNLETPDEAKTYKQLVGDEVIERFGLANSVTYDDITDVFQDRLSDSNAILSQLWVKVVQHYYDNKLPFGRLWDGVLGLV